MVKSREDKRREGKIEKVRVYRAGEERKGNIP